MYWLGLLVTFMSGFALGVIGGVPLWAAVSARARIRVTPVGQGMHVEVLEDSP